MVRLFFLTWTLVLLLAGCGGRSSAPEAADNPGLVDGAGEQGGEADLSGVLAVMTQALRKYSVENRQVPASLEELVTAGYIDRIPPAPQGKRFVIDAKNVQVILR
jgi:hypothetical protein